MPENNAKSEKRMVKFAIYLYRRCARAKQEGVIYMSNPKSENKELHFDHIDAIPRLIRQHLEDVGFAYDVADDSDQTVIAPKSRKRRVIRKVRLGD
jgi:hypothetical protein